MRLPSISFGRSASGQRTASLVQVPPLDPPSPRTKTILKSTIISWGCWCHACSRYLLHTGVLSAVNLPQTIRRHHLSMMIGMIHLLCKALPSPSNSIIRSTTQWSYFNSGLFPPATAIARLHDRSYGFNRHWTIHWPINRRRPMLNSGSTFVWGKVWLEGSWACRLMIGHSNATSPESPMGISHIRN